MNSVPINRNNEIADLAERRAADVSIGRQQLEARRGTLERYRANELAEAEALALARIKADTERALAHQSQALRDAERAAELVTIERRSTDLEATREAQNRHVADGEAALAMAARAEADRLAQQAASEKKLALLVAHEAHQAKLSAEREALAANRDQRRARIALAWVTLRSASPVMVGLVALLLGLGGGWLIAEPGGELRSGNPQFVSGDEAPLSLATELSAPPARR